MSELQEKKHHQKYIWAMEVYHYFNAIYYINNIGGKDQYIIPCRQTSFTVENRPACPETPPSRNVVEPLAGSTGKHKHVDRSMCSLMMS